MITLTHEELINIFKLWNEEFEENPDEFYDSTSKDCESQANTFLEYLAKLRTV